MKFIYTLLLLIFSAVAHAQTISGVEYYYDTDPGVGRATQVSASGSDVDADFSFSINGLSSGVHILYVRCKNAAGLWSSTYQEGIVIANGTGDTAGIVKAEYFFDRDPGFGNGKSVAIGQTNVDGVFNFDVTGLTTGAHTIYIRLLNNSNNWSFAYQGSFVLATGMAGAQQIQSLEYFIDSDNGVGKDSLVRLTAGALLDTTISIHVPDNGGDSRVLGLRLNNSTGQTGNVALADVSLCNIYSPMGGFRMAQFGSTYTMISTATDNPSGKIRWLVNDTLIDSSYAANYVFPAGQFGYKQVQQITGAGCRVDTVSRTISMQGVESYGPYSGAYGADYIMTIYGAGLDTNMNVYLTRGGVVITPYQKTCVDGSVMTVLFDFHAFHMVVSGSFEQVDDYVLHVDFSNGTTYTGPTPVSFLAVENVFACNNLGSMYASCHLPTVDGSGEPMLDITASLSGSTGIRTGVWSDQVLSVTNRSAAVGYGVPFYLLIPSYYDVDTSLWNITNNYPGLIDHVPLMAPLDTVVNGIHLSYKLYAIICPMVAGGATVNYPFRIRTTYASDSNSIYYWCDRNMYGSPLKAYWPPCLEEIANLVIGFTPAGCFNGIHDAVIGSVQKGINKINSSPDGLSLGLTVTGAAISCVPGGALAAKVEQGAAQVAKSMAEVTAEQKGLLIYLTDKAFGGLQALKNIAADGACGDKAYQDWKKKDLLGRAGYDPNYISGTYSYDTARHYTDNYGSIKYEIGFENKASATASAQHVMITDTLDPARFGNGTLRLTGFTIADSMYNVVNYRSTLTRDVVLKNRVDMKVRFTMDFDSASGVLHFDYFSIDNNGRVFPADSLAGFLPPDMDGVSGTGSVRFEIVPNAGPTNSTFSNQAHIYFDANVPFSTNVWTTTIDTTAPKSRVSQAVAINDTTIRLVLQNSDEGSGVKYKAIFAKATSDTVFHKIGITTQDTALFIGDANVSYQFFSRAMDNVGNLEHKDSVGEASYSFTPLPVHLLSFTGVKDGTRSKLMWTSANEVDFSRYEVERSGDGMSFTQIGIVAGKGGSMNNDYVYYDEHPLLAANYYRLRQVDLDGSFVFSRVVRIDFDKVYTVAVSPVPAHDRIIIDGVENFRVVQLIDAGGRVVRQFSGFTGNSFDISGLAAGVYLVRLVSDQTVETLKMMKN